MGRQWANVGIKALHACHLVEVLKLSCVRHSDAHYQISRYGVSGWSCLRVGATHTLCRTLQQLTVE